MKENQPAPPPCYDHSCTPSNPGEHPIHGAFMPSRTTLLALAATIALSLAARAQEALDNAAIVKLAHASLGESLIVQTIHASPGHYDTSTDALIALKQAGVTDKEIGAMIARNAAPAPAPASGAATYGPTLPAGVDEIGVYYQQKDAPTWTQFSPEIVNYKSGGALKSFASQGIVKPDQNGHLNGPSAKVALPHPVQILIYAPEGTAPNEYQLLKFRVHANNREFRSETGGVFHSSSGAQRDSVEFTFQQDRSAPLHPHPRPRNHPPANTASCLQAPSPPQTPPVPARSTPSASPNSQVRPHA